MNNFPKKELAFGKRNGRQLGYDSGIKIMVCWEF
jgi:hypothetical protein